MTKLEIKKILRSCLSCKHPKTKIYEITGPLGAMYGDDGPTQYCEKCGIFVHHGVLIQPDMRKKLRDIVASI